MEFNEKETERLKAVCQYLVEKKHKHSGGHNGLSIVQLNRAIVSILEELVKENKLVVKPTIHGESYFLNQLYYANRNQKSED